MKYQLLALAGLVACCFAESHVTIMQPKGGGSGNQMSGSNYEVDELTRGVNEARHIISDMANHVANVRNRMRKNTQNIQTLSQNLDGKGLAKIEYSLKSTFCHV